jgi:hypothetical protein
MRRHLKDERRENRKKRDSRRRNRKQQAGKQDKWTAAKRRSWQAGRIAGCYRIMTRWPAEATKTESIRYGHSRPGRETTHLSTNK